MATNFQEGHELKVKDAEGCPLKVNSICIYLSTSSRKENKSKLCIVRRVTQKGLVGVIVDGGIRYVKPSSLTRCKYIKHVIKQLREMIIGEQNNG